MKIASLVFLTLLLCSLIVRASDQEVFKKALQAEQAQNWQEAETYYNQIVEMKSHLQEYALFNLANIQKNNGKLSEAKLNYEKLLSLSPNLKLQIDTQFQLAQVHLLEKNYNRAKQYLKPLEKRLRREEIYPQILWAYAEAEKATKNKVGFCKWIKRIYTKFPEFPLAQNWGFVLSKNEFQGTKTNCQASLEEQKNRIKNQLWAGLSEKVRQELKTLKESGADIYEVQRLEVFYLLHEGEVQQALQLLVPLYEQRKNDFNYLVTLASVSARAGEFQTAIGSYYRASKLVRNKRGREALYQSAFLSYQFQDYDGASKRFQEFIKLHPRSGLSRDAEWHLAWIKYLKGDYTEAVTRLQVLKNKLSRKQKKGSSADRIQYWLAMSHLKQKKYEESRYLFEQLAKDPLKGYYSLAAQHRIQKLDLIAPIKVKRSIHDLNRIFAKFTPRFSSLERILPSDDVLVAPEITELETESEENVKQILEGSTLAEESTAEESAEPVEEQVSLESSEPQEAEVVESSKSPFSSAVLTARFDRAKSLTALGLDEWAKWDLYDIERKTTNREYLKKLIEEYQLVENYHRSSYIGQTYFGSQRAQLGLELGKGLWQSAYPRAYAEFVQKYTKQFDIPFELVWAIMRAESQYKKDVISPVGALGLMQVMPSTGKRVAEMLREQNFQPASLLQPETGIRYGSRYLQRLYKKFEGSIPMVAAAYNAGPHRVKTWLNSFGGLELDEFIEHIPFLETRNYVKKVSANFQIYNLLYGRKGDSMLSLAEPNWVRFPEAVFSKETWEEF
jgi:soluble lytic murein transglycosylase